MAVQLEFNIDNKSSQEMSLDAMQKQIDQMSVSMDKVRRKLFAELGEMKRLYADLQKQNEELKNILRNTSYEKTQWSYGQKGCLFDVQESERAFG